MLKTERKYYLLMNIIPYSGIDLDFYILKSGNFDNISKEYFSRERKANEKYRKTFKNIERDKNDGKDYWSFSYVDDKDNSVKYVLCGTGKVRDFVTHI